MSDTIRVEGIAAARGSLLKLERGVRRRVLRKAGNAGGTVGVKLIKRFAPKRNRGLQKSITKKVKTYARNGTVVVVMGQDLRKMRAAGSNKKKRLKGGGISGRGDTVPSHLVENATRAHVLPSRRPILNWFGSGKSTVFTRRIRHPGTKGQNFIRRAHQGGQGAIRRTIETKMIIETSREVDSAASVKI